MNGGLGNDGSPQKPLGAAPKSRTCYICGRMYGTNSYEIHLKQCKQLWIDREAQKDPRERKPLPEDPFANGNYSPTKPRKKRASGGGGGTDEGGDDGEEEVEEGEEGGRQLSLEEMNKIAGAAFNEVALDACQFCGRTFLPEKLKIHNKSCTADNPARRVTDAVRTGHDPVNVSETKGHHKRPSSQGGKRQELASPIPAEDDTFHLRVSNGSLVGSVGSIGGPSGRPLRKQNQNSNKVSQSGENVFGMPDLNNKEEVMAFLANKIVNLEANAASILQELDEVKSMMNTLMNGEKREEPSGIAG